MTGTVRTRGSADVPARPDRAEVFLDVEHLGATADAALADVAGRVAELEALVADLGLGRDQWSTGGVTVGQHREWEGDRQVLRGYRARCQLLVRVAEVELLGRLLTEAVRRARAEVRGPQWVVDPGNEARVAAYRAAAEDARRRAEAYAGALGLGLGAVVSIDEPGLARAFPSAAVEVAAFRAAGHASDADDLPVQPGEVRVGATVEAVFELAPV